MDESYDKMLGIKIIATDLDGILADSDRAIGCQGKRIVFACANPHSLVVARRDPVFTRALNKATHLVADGVGVSAVAWFLGVNVGQRITGGDYFMSMMSMLQQNGGGRVFFFGSSQYVLDRIVARLSVDFPLVTVSGMISPPFGRWSVEQDALFVRAINDTKPDVLWVGMTAPKQETWVESNRHALDVPIIGSIGAVFDFYAGTHPRAPAVFRKAGLEWVYRLVREPKRMWRRNFVSSPLFVVASVWEHIFGLPTQNAILEEAGSVNAAERQFSA